MQVLPQIANRFSCMEFSNTAIDKNELHIILEAGRLAPSAKNRQPWRFIVIEDSTVKKKIEAAAFEAEAVVSAPVLIACCSTNIDYTMPNGQNAYPMDISIASSFMLLQAESMGYASCYISTFDEPQVKEILSVPFSMRVVLLLLIGKAETRKMQKHRKSFNEIFSYNHW